MCVCVVSRLPAPRSGSAQAVCPLNSACVNTPGGYHCPCSPGYERRGTQCVDIDECARNLHACPANSVCENQPGTHRCRCRDGYRKADTGTNCVPFLPVAIAQVVVNTHTAPALAVYVILWRSGGVLSLCFWFFYLRVRLSRVV